MKLTKSTVALILAFSIAAGISCGNGSSATTDSSNLSSDDPSATSSAPSEEYPYYNGKDLGGKTIKVLNIAKKQWDMICYIQPDEIVGETVNDAIFNRNAYVKSKLNFELEEENEASIDNMSNRLQQMVMSDDGEYSAVYMPSYLMASGLTEGYYQCLDNLKNLHLSESWWDQPVLRDTSIGGKHYLASSSAHLMGYDGLWCIYFNEDMTKNLGLEYPYELVRQGKWTLDKLSEYCAAAANLNSDDKFSKKNAELHFRNVVVR